MDNPNECQVSISFGRGSLSEGFQEISIQVLGLDATVSSSRKAYLEGTTNLTTLFLKWRTLYCSLYEALGTSDRGGIEIDRSVPTNISEVDLFELGRQIETELNIWLQPLERELLYLLQGIQKPRIVILSNDEQLRKIPWHLWKLAERCTVVDPAIGNSFYERKVTSRTPEGLVRILAVLGDATGINLDEDVSALHTLPGAYIKVLKSPSKTELDSTLRDRQGWDMVFFSGHSRTENNVGVLDISRTESLTAEELRHALEAATNNGTQLAFFNSCDGLGLASVLERVGFSHVILMREPIPDRIAQHFIRFWLEAFVEGASFHLATRTARERLTILETDYPFATWLPVICQNPIARAPTWQDLQRRGRLNWRKPLAAGLLLASIVVGVRATGALRAMEFGAYDAFLAARLDAEPDPRILVVVGRNEQRFGFPFSDETLAKAIAVLEQSQPRLIGLDILRDALRNKDGEPLFARSNLLVGACSQGEPNTAEGNTQPQSQFGAGVGFVNANEDDPDRTLRRISLFRTPASNDPCETEFYLASRLALSYLQSESIPLTTGDIVQIGDRRVPPLPAYTGAYRHKGYDGYEIMLDYRAGDEPFQTVTIADVLDGRVAPELIRDRVVIIGMDVPNNDRKRLPGKFDVPGVAVVAHTTSQLLDIGLEGRSPIWILPFLAECAWIYAWGLGGAWLGRGRSAKNSVIFIVGFVTLSGTCWLAFAASNGWIPLVPAGIAYGASYAAMRWSGRKARSG